MNARREPWCRLCGKDRPKDGPFRIPKVGPMKGRRLCDQCYGGWRSGRRSGDRWAMNAGRSMRVLMNEPVAANMRLQHSQIVNAFLDGRTKSIGPRYFTDGRVLRVWRNLVAEKQNGSIVLHDAGYRTKLTQSVLNAVLEEAGRRGYPYGRIFQKKFNWYVGTGTRDVPWTGSLVLAKAAAAANPLTRRESARFLRRARVEMADIEGRARKHRHYHYGKASGLAHAVQMAGPRGAAIAAAMVRGRAMRKHRITRNPHAGLSGLMGNGEARKAMRFA